MKSSRLSSAISPSDTASRASKSLRPAFFGAAIALAATFSTASHAERSFRNVIVDTSAIGSDQSLLARQIKASLEPGLRSSFGGRITGDRNSPSLVVRITSVTIQSVPEFSGRDGGNSNTDYMQGEALVVGQGGIILNRYPMLSALNGTVSGWYLPDYEKRKVVALSNHYAYWLNREVPDR